MIRFEYAGNAPVHFDPNRRMADLKTLLPLMRELNQNFVDRIGETQARGSLRLTASPVRSMYGKEGDTLVVQSRNHNGVAWFFACRYVF